MSPMRMGSADVTAVPAQVLAEQAQALGAALELSAYDLEPAAVDLATNLVEKVRERTSIAGSHTVVALAGATGSGKSSLFNALVGGAVSKIGARRPTTSTPTAAIWGDEPAGPLLDWLQVPQRHHVESGAAEVLGSLAGLVLLDLPDFDSRVAAHRTEAERVLELVDVFVWVTDPQKYADAMLHDEHVAALATHDAVTLVVLNQADRLTPAAATQCREDLRRLLAADGLPQVPVLLTSATTGDGVDELRQRLANHVAGANATRQRLSADVVGVATRLRKGVGDTEVSLAGEADDEFVDALARSAGVPVVLAAVADDYRRAATQTGGWLFTRWATSLRADPLARLRLDKTLVRSEVQEAEVRAVLGRSSIPPPSPAARAAVALAIRQLADRAGEGLPVRWANTVADAATPHQDDLADALDQAVVRTRLRARNPLWWKIMGAVQWAFGLAAIVGFLWLLVLGVVGWLQLPPLPTPTLGALPWPFLLFAGSLLLGFLAALITRSAGIVGARYRARLVDKRLREAIRAVAAERVVAPVTEVLDRHRRTRELLERARLG